MGVPAGLKHQALAVHCANRLHAIKLCERRPAQGRRQRRDTREGAGRSALQGGGQRKRGEEEEAGSSHGLIKPQELPGGLLVQTVPGAGSPASCQGTIQQGVAWCPHIRQPGWLGAAQLCLLPFLPPSALTSSPPALCHFLLHRRPFPSLGDEYLEMVTPAEDSPQEAPAGTDLTPHFWLRLPWGLSLQQRFHQESLYQPRLGGPSRQMRGWARVRRDGSLVRGRRCAGAPGCSGSCPRLCGQNGLGPQGQK